MYRLLREALETGNAKLVKQMQADIKRLGDFKLVPVITVILNFSRIRWGKAKSLKELVPAGHPEIIAHMKDYDVEIFDILYLDEEARSRFTSDFRDVVTVLMEGAIDKRHDFQQLKYPVDALDMLYTYTKDKHYLSIRNQIVKKEQKGKEIRMGDFFDQVERNKTIDIAKKMYQRDKDITHAIYAIECGLNVSAEEAQKIFDTEVLCAALV